MSDYRDPKTGKRTAVLRPEDPALSLKRLAEWNSMRDEAEISSERGDVDDAVARSATAKDLWLSMKREQGFRFVGWLSSDGKTTSGGTSTAPGDLNVGELEFEKDWKR